MPGAYTYYYAGVLSLQYSFCRNPDRISQRWDIHSRLHSTEKGRRRARWADGRVGKLWAYGSFRSRPGCGRPWELGKKKRAIPREAWKKQARLRNESTSSSDAPGQTYLIYVVRHVSNAAPFPPLARADTRKRWAATHWKANYTIFVPSRPCSLHGGGTFLEGVVLSGAGGAARHGPPRGGAGTRRLSAVLRGCLEERLWLAWPESVPQAESGGSAARKPRTTKQPGLRRAMRVRGQVCSMPGDGGGGWGGRRSGSVYTARSLRPDAPPPPAPEGLCYLS